MRALITKLGTEFYWAVLPASTISKRPFGTASSESAARTAADEYISQVNRSRGFGRQEVAYVR